MSSEQLLFYVENQKQKLRTAENKKRDKIQSDMLEVDVQDHDDLYSILKNVDKKDVPVLVSRWFTYLTDRTFSCIDKKSACYSRINR